MNPSVVWSDQKAQQLLDQVQGVSAWVLSKEQLCGTDAQAYRVQKRSGLVGLYPCDWEQGGALSLLGHVCHKGNYQTLQALLEMDPALVSEPVDAKGHSVLWLLSGVKNAQTRPMIALCLEYGASFSKADSGVLWRMCALNPQSDLLLYKWLAHKSTERFWESMQQQNSTFHPLYHAVKTPALLECVLEWAMSNPKKSHSEQQQALLNAQKALLLGLKEFGSALDEDRMQNVWQWFKDTFETLGDSERIQWVQNIVQHVSTTGQKVAFSREQVVDFLCHCGQKSPDILINIWGKSVYQALSADRVDSALIHQAQWLLDAKMDPMGIYSAGLEHQRLPLFHLTCLLGSAPLMQKWLDAGASTQVSDRHGRTVQKMLTHIVDEDKRTQVQALLAQACQGEPKAQKQSKMPAPR